MDPNTFYGPEKSSIFSYLEFGSIDLNAGKKEIWDFRLQDKAYDWLMLARYANDMVTYIKMTEMIGRNQVTESIGLYLKEIHHKTDISINIGKLCALAVMKNYMQKGELSFFEIGQTLFGCIEGMRFCQELLASTGVQFPILNLHGVRWYGMDISELFNRISIMLHESYNIKTMSETQLLREQYDVFFAKGVTLLYAVRTIEDLMGFLVKGKVCVFDYSLSMKGEQNAAIGTGKHVKYLDYADFYAVYSKGDRKLYVRKDKSGYNKSTNRIFIDCIYAEEDICRKFIALDMKVRKDLLSELSGEAGALLFLDAKKDISMEWISIEELVEEIKI